MVRVNRVRVEHHDHTAVGIGEDRPRISWSFDGYDKDWTQQSYELELHRSTGKSSYRVESSQSLLVPWPGEPLTTGERVNIRVRVGDHNKVLSEWSEETAVEAGLLNQNEWKCSLIEPDASYEAKAPHHPVIFRGELQLIETIHKARLYITAHGIYQAKINDHSIGDHVLAPGWMAYQHRLVYQTYDATAELKQGSNVIDVEVAEGWHSGRLSWMSRTNIYSEKPGLIAMLVIESRDGRQTVYGTDSQWKWTRSATIAAEVYDGEKYDARKEISNKTRWSPVDSRGISDNLVSPDGPPCRRSQELHPQKIIHSPSGKVILDMGQNMVGWIRVKVGGPADTRITFHFAEVLENGEIGSRPLRTAKCIDTVVLAGEDPIVWEPKFTFHGFRYVQVEGWPQEIDLSNITGVVVHTDMTRTGYFACSNPMLNQLHRNITWGMRGNFVSIPTDCPQRDERLGWTGDINAFADTANYLYDVSGMLKSWLTDLASDQKDLDGIVPVTSPNILPGFFARTIQAIWGDCAIMLPWSIYQFTGDKDILDRQYSSMKLWLDTIPRRKNGLWGYPDLTLILGDWLDPNAPPDEPGNADTDGTLVSDAFLVHVTDLISQISGITNRTSDAEKYAQEAAKLRKAFQHCYITPSGLLANDTQTAYTLAIHFSLLSTPERLKTASARLALLIRLKSRFKISTGFAGTFLLGHACTKVGLSNLFYRMLLERKNPSWLYPVTMGATTVWERWDSMLPSGEINPGEMTSFNHYALGAVASWMHKTISGLSAVEAGWQKFRVEPIPGGGIRWAEGKYISGYGLCSVMWQLHPMTESGEKSGNEEFSIRVRVPPNTSAQIKLPGSREDIEVGSGVHEWTLPYHEPQDDGQKWPPRAMVPPFIPADDELPSDEVLDYDEKLCG